VIPRECDNDDCDYETGVRAGVPTAWWVHSEKCAGPVDFTPTTNNSIDGSSFLSFLKGYE